MSSVDTLRARINSRRLSGRSGGGGGSFVPDEVLSALGSMTRADADAQDFGVVQVDDSGNVLLYNQFQANLVNIRPSSAEGQNWFGQLAPCTNNPLFYDQFKNGVRSGNLNTMFTYTFNYRLRPMNVQIHLYRDGASRTNWIFVRPA